MLAVWRTTCHHLAMEHEQREGGRMKKQRDELMDPMSDMEAAANGVTARTVTRQDGSKAAFFVPTNTQRFTQPAALAVADLQRQALAVQEAQVKGNAFAAHAGLEKVGVLVVRAHAVGVPWDVIGWSTGLPALVAQERWGLFHH
jgi:hypothetical protein